MENNNLETKINYKWYDYIPLAGLVIHIKREGKKVPDIIDSKLDRYFGYQFFTSVFVTLAASYKCLLTIQNTMNYLSK